MNDPKTSVPEIIENLNPVTEQFGQAPPSDTLRDVADIVSQLLTEDEQKICDAATD